MKRLLYNQISMSVNLNILLNPLQSGFRTKHNKVLPYISFLNITKAATRVGTVNNYLIVLFASLNLSDPFKTPDFDDRHIYSFFVHWKKEWEPIFVYYITNSLLWCAIKNSVLYCVVIYLSEMKIDGANSFVRNSLNLYRVTNYMKIKIRYYNIGGLISHGDLFQATFVRIL